MLHSKRFLGLLVLATSCGLSAHLAGCGDDDARTPTEDAGTPDTSIAADTGAADASTTTDAADAAKPAPVFLDPSEYTDLITIDATFPYGVTGKHAGDTSIAGATWGTTGPIVTMAPGPTPGAMSVASWTIPSDAKAAATSTSTTAAQTDVPAGVFYSGGGFAALPFGPLQSYTGSFASGFAGEALLYSADYSSIVSRAFANGFYAGVGVTDGTTTALVYSGLSPLTAAAAASPTDGNGLWSSSLCAGKLAPTGACAASHQLITWSGSSGPVVTDTLGDVFVAASLGANGEIYGLTKAQALGTGAATKVTLATDDSLGGTGSAAALAEPGAAGGWVVTIGFPDFKTGAVPPVRAVEFTSSAAGIAKGAKAFGSAITPATGVTGVAVFNDTAGNLWLAVTTATAGTFLELQKKP